MYCMTEKFKTRNPINVDEIPPFEALPGIFRHTLAYKQDTMLCLFKLEKGADIPVHNHVNVQIGYIISGKIQFLSENPEHEFIAQKGLELEFESRSMQVGTVKQAPPQQQSQGAPPAPGNNVAGNFQGAMDGMSSGYEDDVPF